MCPGTAAAGGCFCGPLIGELPIAWAGFPFRMSCPGVRTQFSDAMASALLPTPIAETIVPTQCFLRKGIMRFFAGCRKQNKPPALCALCAANGFSFSCFRSARSTGGGSLFSAGLRLHRLARHFDDALHFLFCGRPMRPSCRKRSHWIPICCKPAGANIRIRRKLAFIPGIYVSIPTVAHHVLPDPPLRRIPHAAHRSHTGHTDNPPQTARACAFFLLLGSGGFIRKTQIVSHETFFSLSCSPAPHTLCFRRRGSPIVFLLFVRWRNSSVPVTPNARHTPPFWGCGCEFQQSRPAHFFPALPPHPNRASPAPRGRSCSKKAARLWQ